MRGIEATRRYGAFFSFHSQRTAGGAECSPTDLVESKRRVGGETTKKEKKGEQKMGSVSFIHHCNLGRWIASVAVRVLMQSIPTTEQSNVVPIEVIPSQQ